MTASISIVMPTSRFDCPVVFENHKIVMDLSAVTERSFDVEIIFDSSIVTFRNHDYTWVKPDNRRVSGVFSPKALQLTNGQFIQPNTQTGIWEVSKENPKRLLWRFNPENSAPLAMYSGPQNQKNIARAESDFPKTIALLFSKTAIEFSRSPLPFSAIACFTDHCDFDTAESLRLQREFFKSAGIKTTKGFFLNHYSKRADNASFEKHAEELKKWQDDRHELAYHSLSQSIKNDAESFADFESFNPPFAIPTWIDHGYQPYNLSLYKNYGLSDETYAETLKSKSIKTMWNYIDSGTATKNVINQLNPDDFTLDKFKKGNSKLGFRQKLSLLVKNIMFHYYADEQIIGRYKSTAGDLKNIAYNRNLKKIFPMLRHAAGLATPMLKVLLFWNSYKNTPYKFAKYTPVLFRHVISGRPFYIFQTLEMVDFRKALQPANISKLINEHGLFIAHTYFSAPMSYHTGRMFSTPEKIDREVGDNFRHLGEKIKSGDIWNPTLDELVTFLANFEKTVLDIDAEGNTFVANASGVPYRTIS